jgi:dephospho-CoA kinase
VAKNRAEFAATVDADIVVFDIPLLFETGGDTDMDANVCVFVPDDIQEQRVIERGTMTREQFLAIRAKQMSTVQKCAGADYLIMTDTLAHARAQVCDVVRQIRAGFNDA